MAAKNGLFRCVFPSFFGRFPILGYTLDHHHQFLPTSVECVGLFIKNRQFERTRFEFQMVDDQPAAFHVQDLHTRAEPVDKDEYIAILHVALHQVGHDAAQSIETLAHVRWVRVDEIPHRGRQVEHDF